MTDKEEAKRHTQITVCNLKAERGCEGDGDDLIAAVLTAQVERRGEGEGKVVVTITQTLG